jgi:opacity protein-like surface antigen
MIRFFTICITISLLSLNSFGASQKEINDSYPVLKLARSQNYYELPNPNSGYSNGKTNSLDGYRNNQYRGKIKNNNQIKPYANPQVYMEMGIRGINVVDTDLDHTDETSSLDVKNMSFDTGYGAAMKFGLESIHHRFDFEFSYETSPVQEFSFDDPSISSLKFQDAKLNAFTFNLNYYKDFLKNKKISPYIGAGVGVIAIELDIGKSANNQDVDVGKGFDKIGNYQLILGTRINLNRNHKLNLNYKYRSTFTKFELPTTKDDGSGGIIQGDPVEVNYAAHLAEISYQILF